MAHAKERMVEKTVNVPDGVNLELSGQEAQVLRHVLSRITGPSEGPRGIALEIGRALRHAGVTKPTLTMISGNRILGYSSDPAYTPKSDGAERSSS